MNDCCQIFSWYSESPLTLLGVGTSIIIDISKEITIAHIKRLSWLLTSRNFTLNCELRNANKAQRIAKKTTPCKIINANRASILLSTKVFFGLLRVNHFFYGIAPAGVRVKVIRPFIPLALKRASVSIKGLLPLTQPPAGAVCQVRGAGAPPPYAGQK